MPDIAVLSQRNPLNPNAMTFDERKQDLKEQEEARKIAEKKEKNSPYSNWYQFNRDHTAEMIWLTNNHPKAQVILLFLLDQMDDYNAVMCSYQVLQEALDMSTATITRAIKILKDKGYVAILKSGTSNVYVVNKDLAWGSWGKNFRYCKFPANVVLSATENSEYLEKIKATKIKSVDIQNKD